MRQTSEPSSFPPHFQPLFWPEAPPTKLLCPTVSMSGMTAGSLSTYRSSKYFPLFFNFILRSYELCGSFYNKLLSKSVSIYPMP